MNIRPSLITALVLICLLALYATVSQAQTPTTRVTACNAATPNNAVCISWNAVTTYNDGTPIPSTVTVGYRVEQKAGANGTWATIANPTGPRQYVTSLDPGVYFWRVFAIAPTGTSAPSNETTRGVTSETPSAPVTIIAMEIRRDGPPVLVTINGQKVYASTSRR